MYPLLDSKYLQFGTIYPYLRVQGGSWLFRAFGADFGGSGSGISARELRVSGPEFRLLRFGHLLGGSWVVISRVTSRATLLITHFRGLKTPLITTPEPPSRGLATFRIQGSRSNVGT